MTTHGGTVIPHQSGRHEQHATPSARRLVADAFAAYFPDLRGNPDYLHELAETAAFALRGGMAGRCRPVFGRHPWTRWRVVDKPGGAFQAPRQVQERECLRCGRIERDEILTSQGAAAR